MIHNASCHIVIDPVQMGGRTINFGIEPPIATDEQIEEVFPNWKSQYQIFIGRCLKEENREWASLSPQDVFRYGMKFILVEAQKLA